MVILEVWGNKFPRVDKIWAKGRHCPPCPPPNDATARGLRVIEFFGLHFRDPEEILDHFDVSYVPNKNIDFSRWNSPSPRRITNLITVFGQ